MVVCEVCGGNCDNGELIGGVCPECIEEKRIKKERADLMERMTRSRFCQMGFDLQGVRAADLR